MDLIHPHTKADVAEALREASAAGTRVLPVGGRRHMDRGNPTEVDAELWTTMLDQVVAYDPAEMLAVVGAGMRVGDLAAMLSEYGQEWPVDAPADATVGGVIAAGISSTRRLRVGLMRDTVAELELATGDGRLVRSGARTVKNVTGYDVHRLATGSLGSLGVIVQVALKVRPLPAATATLVTPAGGLELAEALLAEVPLPAAVVAEPDRVILRLEGWPAEIEEQSVAASAVGDMTSVPSSELTWPDAPIVVEAAVPPSRLGEMVSDASTWTALAGVGLTWIGAADGDELARIRTIAAQLGGIAPVVRGPGGLGDTAVAAPEVHRRLKVAFDPAGIMSPGRFWGGI
ncbi:MAG: FAD-binding protein [Actinomycetota bacterium]